VCEEAVVKRWLPRAITAVTFGAVRAAISIPDEIFQRAERHAAQLGITRSEFFTRAAQWYSADLEAESMTERINAALAAAGDDDSNDVVARHGRQSLQDTDDDW